MERILDMFPVESPTKPDSEQVGDSLFRYSYYKSHNFTLDLQLDKRVRLTYR